MLQTLHCQIGNHEWTRETKRGRKPINCPEHKPAIAVVNPKPISGYEGDVQRRVLTTAQQKKMATARKHKSASEREKKIREIMASPKAERCKCGITPKSTDDELRAMCLHSCTPNYVCPTLDTCMRTVYTYA